MILTENHNQRNKKYVQEFECPNFSIKMLPRVEKHNELIIIENLK
jgi:hypothetical protein